MRFVGYTTVDQPLIAKILHDKDLAIQDLKNHFYTRIGERVMDPEFGSIIPLMIFEPLDDISVQEIEADVWVKPNDDSYFFKKSHSYGYALAIIVQLNLICEG